MPQNIVTGGRPWLGYAPPPMTPLLEDLLVPRTPLVTSLQTLTREFETLRARFDTPFDRAVAAGARSDRLAYAFAAGYQAALDRLLGPTDVGFRSLCVTEVGGGHPRAIESRLVQDHAGGWRLTGTKRWASFGSVAEELFVVASEGLEDSGKKRLRVVRVRKGSQGLTVTPMAQTPFIPEIPHAELTLDNVPGTPLEGDGYLGYVKPFRTLEDIHVLGATLGYGFGASRRAACARSFLEDGLGLLFGFRALAEQPPLAPEGHLALAGLFRRAQTWLGDAQWSSQEESARWERDRTLLAVANRARGERLETAWRQLGAKDSLVR